LFGLFCLYRLFVVGSSRTTWHSFRGTFHTFFVSSVYINVALCLAVTITVAFEDRTEHTAIFASLGFLLSLASTQALWALYRLYIRSSTKDLGETTEKPTILTETLLIRLCLGCLWVALLVLCAYIIKVGWDSNFETFCFHELGARPFARRLLYAPIGIASIGLILAVLRQIFPGEANSRRWGWVYPTMAFLGFILMWLAFGALWFLRTQLGTIAGDTYQDDQWGFGQVIAVAAWLPSLVDIVREVFRVVRSCRSDPGTHPTEELELGSGLGQR
jgi:hypothetical protein